jgi:hypothetical protein
MGKNNDFEYLNRRIDGLIEEIGGYIQEIELLKEYLDVELVEYKDRGSYWPFGASFKKELVKKAKKKKKDE